MTGVLAGGATAAKASVIYTLEDFPGTSLTYTAPDFITADTVVSGADITGTGYWLSTVSVSFLTSCPDGGGSCNEIFVHQGAGPTDGSYFYFSPGAFGVSGNYGDVVNPGPTNLTVDLQTTAPVPEPMSMALLGGGLVAVGALRRRRAG